MRRQREKETSRGGEKEGDNRRSEWIRKRVEKQLNRENGAEMEIMEKKVEQERTRGIEVKRMSEGSAREERNK